MEIEKKEEPIQNKFDKYTKWLGVIENVEGEPELGDSNKNIYDLTILRKVEIINENFLLPIYVKSPSELDGFSESEEKKIKFYLLLIMQEAGIILRVPQNTILTSQLIFNRFFWRVSLKSYEPFIIAMTSFYIGCKSEETYRRIRDVISVFNKLFTKKKQSEVNEPTKTKVRESINKTMSKSNVKSSKESEEAKLKYLFILDICSEEYKILKNNICFYEIQILKELGFSIYSLCDHPHKYLTHFIKHLKGTKELLQKSWNYLNDAYKTDIPVHYPPHVIACSAIFLAARFFKLPLPQAPWWEIYDTKVEEIQEICSTLLSLNELYCSNSVFNIKLSEISKILFSRSNLKAAFELQEKAKLDLLEKEKREKAKEKTKNVKEKKFIKYEYGKRKRSHSCSRSRSRSEKRHQKRQKSKDHHHRKDRKRAERSYSESSLDESLSKSEKRSSSESSSSIDPEKIKRRINIMEREHKRKSRRSPSRKRSRHDYNSPDSEYRKHRKSKNT